jgi:hypothetical protein
MIRYLAAFLLLLGMAAYAGKRSDDPVAELERLRTDLRLRTAELAVTRGQLRACQRRQ